MVARLVIAGTASGVGKTTVTVGLTRALRARDLRVAVFKCGPDYLDPTYHARAADAVCENLDGWMMGHDAVAATFASASRGADIALIEGVMGLHDGASPTSDEGSTAEIARWLAAPIVLVCDASGMARSIAALARGFAAFDPTLTVAGIVCNRVGSRGHLELLRKATAGSPRVLGGLPVDAALSFPERHLGLHTADTTCVPDAHLVAWGEQAAEWLDLDAIVDAARAAPRLTRATGAHVSAESHPAETHPAETHCAETHSAESHPAAADTAPTSLTSEAARSAETHSAESHSAETHCAETHSAGSHSAESHSAEPHSAETHCAGMHPAAAGTTLASHTSEATPAVACRAGAGHAAADRASPRSDGVPTCRIGIAFDEAFHFYYDDNLRRLEALGVTLVRFSPIHDAHLPAIDGLYFGGGYPEVHAETLADNAAMRAEVAAFAAQGGPIYAECGGLMYLAQAIRTLDGRRHAMVGIVPCEIEMRDRLVALGYVEVELQARTLLGGAGMRFRGHQFRYSELRLTGEVDHAYTVRRRRGGDVAREGYRVGSTLASYVHAHWASNPLAARALVATCVEHAGRSTARSP